MTISIEVARRKWAERAAGQRLQKTSAWRPLQTYLEKTRSTGCGYVDYWHLYEHVRRYRPREVLELGTGASTIVLAHALLENGHGGRLTSMEESETWYRHAVENQPPELPVDLVLSGTVEDTFSLFRGIRYRHIPERAYDFVFVDGPTYRTEDGEITFDFDLIRLVANATGPLRAIIDKRISTCFVLQRLLPGKVRYVPHLGLTFVDEVTQGDLRSIDRRTPSSSFRLRSVVDFAGL